MKTKLIAVLCFLSLMPSIWAQTQDFSPSEARLKQNVYFLASDSLRGRKAGTEDAHKAADFIIADYKASGLKPLFSNFLVPFQLESNEYAQNMGDKMGGMVDDMINGLSSKRKYNNIVGIIEGNDPKLKHEFIVVGAHYDHLGVNSKGEIFNGADDNASGTAAVMEIARMLIQQQSKLKRSVIIASFDAEEMGLYGSKALADKLLNAKDSDTRNCPILKDAKIVAMMSIDMVGWLSQSGSLKLEGTGTIDDGKDLIKDVAAQIGIPVHCKKFENSIFTATDTEPFAKAGIPTLAVSTGLKSPYHKPEDDADLIDYKGLAQVVDFLTELTLRMSTMDDFAGSGHFAGKHGEKVPAVEMGLSLGFNRLFLNFTDAGFTTHSKLGWHGGAMARIHFGQSAWGLQIEGLYNQPRTYMPYLQSSTDPSIEDLRSKVQTEQYLTIPVSLTFSTPGRAAVYGLAGGYYGINLANNESNPWGWQWGFGVRLGKTQFQFTGQYQLNNIFTSANATMAKRTTYSFTLTYLLW